MEGININFADGTEGTGGSGAAVLDKDASKGNNQQPNNNDGDDDDLEPEEGISFSKFMKRVKSLARQGSAEAIALLASLRALAKNLKLPTKTTYAAECVDIGEVDGEYGSYWRIEFAPLVGGANVAYAIPEKLYDILSERGLAEGMECSVTHENRTAKTEYIMLNDEGNWEVKNHDGDSTSFTTFSKLGNTAKEIAIRSAMKDMNYDKAVAKTAHLEVDDATEYAAVMNFFK